MKEGREMEGVKENSSKTRESFKSWGGGVGYVPECGEGRSGGSSASGRKGLQWGISRSRQTSSSRLVILAGDCRNEKGGGRGEEGEDGKGDEEEGDTQQYSSKTESKCQRLGAGWLTGYLRNRTRK